MSNSSLVNVTNGPGIEARHIYTQKYSQPNRQHQQQHVELVLPSHIEEADEEDFNYDDDKFVRKKNLRLVEDDVRPQAGGGRQSYDPWRDIYLRGNFDRQRFGGQRRKGDRKSLDYDYDNEEYEYEEDEDLPSYNRRPYLSDNPIRRRKRPTDGIRRNKTKSGMGYYDYEDPSKLESTTKKDQLMFKPQDNPSLTRRVMNVISPFSGSIVTIAAVLAVPVLLAAGYWLLVVNGPTPVVKARIDDPDFDGEADPNDVTEIGQAVRDIFRTLWNEVENFAAKN